MEERRKYIRIPDHLEIVYEVLPKGMVNECVIKDISQRGIKFLAHECIPKDNSLKIRIGFPRSLSSFEALAKCIWVREVPHSDDFEVAVEFVDLPPVILKFLIGYIEDFINSRDNKK
jgi:hypothetical protein